MKQNSLFQSGSEIPNKRFGYEEQIVVTASRQLTEKS